MAAKFQLVEVASQGEIDGAINAWIMQGYTVANRTATSATLVKRKEFSVLWAVIGFVVCLLPLLIYLFVYAADSDRVVEIRVTGANTVDPYDELDRLNELFQQGVVSQVEYDMAKRRLLSQ